MSILAYITLFTIMAMIYLLIRTKVRMDVVFLLGMLVFLSTGVLDEKQVFSGFVSNACIVVIFFFIIIAAMIPVQEQNQGTHRLYKKYQSIFQVYP